MTDSTIRQSMISAREEYSGRIRDELLGPGSEFSLPDKEHELISSTPTSRYSVGILFPQGNAVDQDNDETVELEETDNSVEDSGSFSGEDPGTDPVQQKKQRTYAFDETADENLDEEIEMATQYMPSSMGITFIVNGNANIVRGCLSFATYRNAKVPDCMIPYLPNDPDTYRVPPELAHIMVYDKDVQALRLISSVTAKEVRNIFERDTIPENEFSILQKIAYRFVDYCAMGYVRVPHEISEFVLDFSHGDYADDEANHNLDGTDAKLVALRRKIGDNLWSITIMLVNDRKESPVKANRCIFQAKIKISSENNDFIFVERNCVNLTLRFPIYPPFHTSSHPQSLHQPHKSSQLLLRHRPQPDGDGFLPQPVTLPGGQVQANIQYTYVSNRKSTIFFCRIPLRLMRSSVSVDNTSFS